MAAGASAPPALGSDPADCPISCHYLPPQAFCDCTPPLSEAALGDTGALRVSQHQGVYWQAMLYSGVTRRCHAPTRSSWRLDGSPLRIRHKGDHFSM